VMLFNSVK